MTTNDAEMITEAIMSALHQAKNRKPTGRELKRIVIKALGAAVDDDVDVDDLGSDVGALRAALEELDDRVLAAERDLEKHYEAIVRLGKKVLEKKGR